METINPTDNCFNFIRLYACINVLLYHIGWFMAVKVPVLSSLVNPINGVPVFFLISGFLIWLSIGRTKDFKSFCIKRVLRLYPELWFSIIIEVVCLLLFYEGIDIDDYLQMIILQSTVFPNHTPAAFDSYGIGSLNISLWTIPIIIQFYISIWFLYKWLDKKTIREWIIVMLLSIVCGVIIELKLLNFLPAIVNKVIGLSILSYLWMFLFGSFVAKFFSVIMPFLVNYWYVSLIALAINELYPFSVVIVPYTLIGSVLLACSIFGIAYRFKKIKIKHDVSYAIYLYHMLFVNVAIQIGYRGNVMAVVIIIALSFIFAYFSTMAVDKFYKKSS
ncbi:MAG: acyltransferase [Bacteroides xylanisolvens]|nr:MAG: acyltransferase [Bacteroides xylanisolvens]